MFCNYRLAVAALVALSALVCSSVQAQVKPFKIRGSGIAPTGLPLPGQAPRVHDIVGNATELGRYTGTGTVQTDTADFHPENGTITGEFGGGSPYTFVAANGDELVAWYGRTDHGAADPGTFTLTIQEVLPDGNLVVTAEFIAEFVVQPDLSTGRFAGTTGSWIMYAFTEEFVLGSSDPIAYRWEGEGKLKFPKKK